MIGGRSQILARAGSGEGGRKRKIVEGAMDCSRKSQVSFSLINRSVENDRKGFRDSIDSHKLLNLKFKIAMNCWCEIIVSG